MWGLLQKKYSALHESQFLVGVMILLANIGSRYIVLEFSKTQEEFLSGEIARKVFLFAAAFVATRDLLTAFLLTAAFTVMVSGIFHEGSRYCLLPEPFESGPTEEEVRKAQAVLDRHSAHQEKKFLATLAVPSHK